MSSNFILISYFSWSAEILLFMKTRSSSGFSSCDKEHQYHSYFNSCLQTKLTIQNQTQPSLPRLMKHNMNSSYLSKVMHYFRYQLTSSNLTQPHHTTPNLPQYLITSPNLSHPRISSQYWNLERSLIELSCTEISSILIFHGQFNSFSWRIYAVNKLLSNSHPRPNLGVVFTFTW